MATPREELEDMIIEADAAGDQALVQRIKARIHELDGGAPAASAAPAPAQPSFLKKALGYVTGTLADNATVMGSLGGATNALLGLGGAAASYLVPHTGSGSFMDRWTQETQGLNERIGAARQNSPLTTPAAEVAGWVSVPTPPGMSPATTATQSLPKTPLGLAARTAAAITDAAAFKTYSRLLSGQPLTGEETYPLGTKGEGAGGFFRGLGTAAQTMLPMTVNELGPWAAAKAAQHREEAGVHAANALALDAKQQQIAEENIFGVSQHNPRRGRAEVGQRILDYIEPKGYKAEQIAGKLGERMEKSSQVLEQARAAAEPTARVNVGRLLKELEGARDAIFSNADLTVPERVAARGRVDEAIDLVRQRYIPRADGTGAVKDIPLSEYTHLKSLWQGIANKTTAGNARVSDQIEGQPRLEFYQRGGGALRTAEEEAIADVLPPPQARDFMRAKSQFGEAATFLPWAKATGVNQMRGGEAAKQMRNAWSIPHLFTRLGMDRLVPTEGHFAYHQNNWAKGYSGLADYGNAITHEAHPAFGTLGQYDPAAFNALMATLLRQQNGEQ